MCKKRSLAARALEHPIFRMRIVKNKKKEKLKKSTRKKEKISDYKNNDGQQ